MGTKGNMTREQAVAEVGEQAVAAVEAKSKFSDFTSCRAFDNGKVEFSASVEVDGKTLVAYYYTTQDALDDIEDLDALVFEIEGFDVKNYPTRGQKGSTANPSPEEIREVRKALGLTQTAAAATIQSTLRAWQEWEAGNRRMHPGLWELFRTKTKGKK